KRRPGTCVRSSECTEVRETPCAAAVRSYVVAYAARVCRSHCRRHGCAPVLRLSRSTPGARRRVGTRATTVVFRRAGPGGAQGHGPVGADRGRSPGGLLCLSREAQR